MKVGELKPLVQVNSRHSYFDIVYTIANRGTRKRTAGKVHMIRTRYYVSPLEKIKAFRVRGKLSYDHSSGGHKIHMSISEANDM